MAIPKKDSLLVPYSANFNDRIVAAPVNFGLTAAQATRYTVVHAPYVAAYEAMTEAREAGTRSQSLTAAKDTAKAELLEYGRELYAFVQANTVVSAANKELLGVRVRDVNPTPVPPPTERPGMIVVSAFARTVMVRIFDEASRFKRGKPVGALGANVYSFVGTTYPTDPTTWQYEGQATKPDFQITFPDTVEPGSQVWITAAWYNRKGETGPPSVPVTTFVQGGLSMAA